MQMERVSHNYFISSAILVLLFIGTTAPVMGRIAAISERMSEEQIEKIIIEMIMKNPNIINIKADDCATVSQFCTLDFRCCPGLVCTSGGLGIPPFCAPA